MREKEQGARLRTEREQLAKALLTLLPAELALPEEEILAQLAQLDWTQ